MTDARLDVILGRLPTARPDDLQLLQELVDALRPRRADDGDAAVHALRSLIYLLQQHPHWQQALRRYLLGFLATRRQLHLYTDTGIYRNEGFFSAAWRSVVQRFFPDERRPERLRDVIGLVFDHPRDHLWLRAVPMSLWQELLQLLSPAEHEFIDERRRMTQEMLDAVQVLSYRISGIGLEPELVRNYPAIEDFESPFLTQNLAVRDYLESYAAALREQASDPLRPGGLTHEDDSHVRVLLGQCTDIISKIRKNAAREGVSISLTYLLERLCQCIERLQTLLDLLENREPILRQPRLVRFWLDLIEADQRSNSVRDLISRNTELIALQVTEHASRTGEHYVTGNRREYWLMLQSAMGAGFIVGFMALLKILTAKLKLAPLAEAFAFSMNYSFGFMLVHVLHFTIATKQPAMTASRLAASIHKGDEIDSLVQMIVSVFRSQFIAIIGNVCIALPTAWAIAALWSLQNGTHIVTPEKAQLMLRDINPIDSLALFYAAIAGVWLFLAGLISGYYDNKAIYARIPQRLRQRKTLRRLLGEQRLQRLSDYVERNLGALAGNFYFGIMLGSTGTLGYLLGLPIDIRHITFSAANFAYALVALDYKISWQVLLLSLAGVAGIGLTNLLVSFGLALTVALKARRVSLFIGRDLAIGLLRHFLRHPSHFFWPPRQTSDSEKRAPEPPNG